MLQFLRNRLVGESRDVGELGEEGKDENDRGEHGDEVDWGDGLDELETSPWDKVSSRDGESETSELSCSFLLLTPLSCPCTRPSPNMQFFNRLTSASFTGFTMKSSAPSSKHLMNIIKT